MAASSIVDTSELGQPDRHPGFETSTRLWLLRHAEVREDYQGRAYGNLDVPLSEEGLADTERLAQDFGRLEIASIVSSPLSRANLLAEGISKYSGVDVVVEPGLAEIYRGTWQGQAVSELPAAQVAEFYADPWSWRAHEGENDSQLLARSWPVVENHVAGETGRDVIFVAHYNVIRVLVAHALGIPASASFSLRIDPGRAALLLDVRAEPSESRTEIPQTSGWVLRHSNVQDPHAIVGLREDEQ